MPVRRPLRLLYLPAGRPAAHDLPPGQNRKSRSADPPAEPAPNSLRQEFAEFYRRFDASFLEIFPRFIEQVDALLLPEARIEPRSPRSLTTELRILAAIRLGITDSGRIARFLNCAPTTVYTYRTKLRNMALDREGFEERIRRIGLFDAEEHLYKTDNEK